MIDDVPPSPPAASETARAEAAYGIAASGKPGDLVKLQQTAEAQGWRTRWMVVGNTSMLFIVVQPSTPPDEIAKLMGAINSKQMGELTAGLARVGGDR